jgi:2-succinyl-5-enolpyruvyl-6-hydroxy-3-cyclohexene-1-carboxylate synthase
VKAFGGYYKLVKSWKDFRSEINKASSRKTFSVLEIKTDAASSLKLRQTYWNEVNNQLNIKNEDKSGSEIPPVALKFDQHKYS